MRIPDEENILKESEEAGNYINGDKSFKKLEINVRLSLENQKKLETPV